jgi:hypothetical protein
MKATDTKYLLHKTKKLVYSSAHNIIIKYPTRGHSINLDSFHVNNTVSKAKGQYI